MPKMPTPRVGQIVVGGTEVQVIGFNPARSLIALSNISSVPVVIDFFENIDVSRGYPLPPYAQIALDTKSSIYAITDGTAGILGYMEE